MGVEDMGAIFDWALEDSLLDVEAEADVRPGRDDGRALATFSLAFFCWAVSARKDRRTPVISAW
jgi:hypothetical protein